MLLNNCFYINYLIGIKQPFNALSMLIVEIIYQITDKITNLPHL